MTRSYGVLALAVLQFGLTACDSNRAAQEAAASVTVPEPGGQWELVWSDDFEGDAIDIGKWSHEINCWGGGNNELQCYTDAADNSYVKDGKLHIVARQQRHSGSPVNKSRQYIRSDSGGVSSTRP
jgi:beta-glucanase (GH16 family)